MKNTALTEFTVDPDASAHQSYQSRCDRQPQPGSTILSGCGVVRLCKGFEYRLLSFRRNADAGITYGEMQYHTVLVLSFLDDFYTKNDLASFCKFDGIPEKIEENLP